MRILIVLSAVLLLAGCSASVEEPGTTAPGSTAASAVSTASTASTSPASTAPASTTTTAGVAFSLADLDARITEEWPFSADAAMWGPIAEWTCALVTDGPLALGSIARCDPSEIPADSQFPILTVLIIDTADGFSVAQSGVEYPVLDPEAVIGEFGSGHLCREILADGLALQQQLPTSELQYFGALLYWFMDGQPERMDADTNGIPCETLFPAGVVDAVWGGGWVEG